MYETPRKPRQAQPGRTIVAVLIALFGLALLSSAFAYVAPVKQSFPLHLRASIFSEDENAECRHVHRQQDQCAWIHTHCVDEDAGLFSYLDLYYCKLPHVKPVGFAIIAAWTALLFSTIGIAASDFFCVNLSTISNILGISENMAGVTFLAFGNGSPDVFSTFAAIRSNSGSLAVGELIGAAGFITAVVSGSMALVRPFKVARKSFVRDVTFFAIAVAFSMVFCANGALELWECAVMVAFYVFYVLVVVIWHWWLSQQRTRRNKHAMVRGHYPNSGSTDEFVFEDERGHDEDDETTPLRPEVVRHASLEDFIDLERANAVHDDVLEQLDEGEQRQQWLGEINSSMRITQTPIAERRNISGAIRPSLVGALEFQSTLNSIRRSRNIQSIPIHLRRYSDEPAFTLAQQQAHLHDTHSFISDPESAVASREIYSSDVLRSGNDHDNTSRSRAKSANAADLLALPDRPTRVSDPSQRDIDHNVWSARLSEMNDTLGTEEGPSKDDSYRTPTISINAPEDYESPAFASSPSHLPDSTSSPSTHYLAPPAQQSHSTADQGQDHVRHERPRLRISPPTSTSQSKGASPRLSPFPLLREGLSPSGVGLGGLVLGPPALKLDDMTQSPDALNPRPLPWWPYKYFVPPQELLRTLLPTLYLWNEKNIWGKLVAVAAAPSFLLLTLTLPVVEPQASEASPPPNLTPVPQSSKPSAGLSDSFLSSTPDGALFNSSNSTAQVAVHTEQNHRHAAGTEFSSSSVDGADVAPEHPHAAVLSSTSWNRWLVLVQTYTAPYIVMITVWANFYEASPELLVVPSIACVICSSAAFVLVLLTTTASRPPKWHWLLCFVGFAVSITWISTIANEVVGVLKAIGVIFDISDTILGLTIFAVGNSLGDLVADITVARLGFPVMALSACFGGPMLNILLGIGLSGLYMTISGAEKRKHKHPEKGLHFKPYHIEVSTTLLISAAALLVTLLGLLIVVPLNGWRMDRKIGWGLIILWVLSTAGNLGVELSGIGDLW